MICTINPYSQEINSDEFILLLNANNLYRDYRSLIDNDEDLMPFFNTNKGLFEESITSIKQLRSLLKGESTNLKNINNNKVINYFLNNAVNQNILNEVDYNFASALYKMLERGKPLTDLLNINELFTINLLDSSQKGNNPLIVVLAKLVAAKLDYLKKIKETDSEFEKEYLNRKIEYINSLGLTENINKPITTKENFKNNTRLRQLVSFLGREGLFTLDTKLVEDINNEIEDLEENIQIYDKNPLTEDPSDKISTRLKLLLRSIPQYDSLGKNTVKINNVIPKYWKPSDLIFKLLKRVSKNRIHNLTASQILDILKNISENESDPLAKAVQLFLTRFNTIKKNQEDNKVTNYDILTDLFMYFQQMPVGIKITEERENKLNQKNTEIIDATDFSDYQINQIRKNVLEDLLMNFQVKSDLNQKITPVSINIITNVLTNLIQNSVSDNKEVVSQKIKNLLKIGSVLTESTLTQILNIVITENNVLNTTEVGKVFNINNDTLYPVIRPSELTEKISLINNSILQIKNGIPFEDTDFYKTFKDDIIIKSIWSDYIKNKGKELKISIFTGFKTSSKVAEWSDFNDGEFLANMFNLLSNNLYHTPVLSDKSNIYLIENFNQGIDVSKSDEDVFEEYSSENKTVQIPFFKDIISFLEMDISLLENVSQNSIGKNIDKAINTQKLFLFNPELYDIENRNVKITNDYLINLYNKYKNPEKNSEKINIEIELSEIINKYFNTLARQYLQSLIDEGYIVEKKGIYILNWRQDLIKNPTKYLPTKSGSDALLNDIKQAAIKSYIYSNHISLISNGHPAFFKQNDEQKRTKAVVADTIKPNIEASYKGKRLFDTTNPKSRRIVLKDVNKAVVNEIAEQFMLQSLKDSGLSKDLILNRMAKIYSNYTLLDGTPIYTLEKDSFTKLKEEYNNQVKEINENAELSEEDKNSKLENLKNSFLNKEKEIKHEVTTLSNTTDASSVASLDHARKYNISLNMHSDEQEEFYEAEKSGKSLNKFTLNNNKIIKNAVYTKVKSKNTNVLVPHMEKTSTDNFTAQRVFIGEKPNLYQAMIGRMFGYTFNEATKSWSYNPNNAITDKIVYESAIKAEMLTDEEGVPIIFDLQKEIEDNNITSLEDVNNWKADEEFLNKHIIEIPFTEDRLQVETPEHLESEGDLGSQIEALIHNSIDINQEYIIGNKIFNGKDLTQLLNDLKITMTNNGANKVREKFADVELLHELILELYNERDHLNPETLTIEKLEELLKNQQFGLALASKIQSTIRKNIVKTKMNTVQFFNGVVGEDDSLKMITEIVKDSEGKEIKQLVFEVAVPAFSEDIFKGALNENNELDVNLLPDEIKNLIVYRIPTEAVYSMFVVRIKKLLHPAAGPIIYMPIGTTNMAGFDMDIDKLFGILKNYRVNKEGKIKVIPYSLEKDNNINFKEWLKENISETDKESQIELFEQKNKLIENNQDILNTNKELKDLLNQKNKIIKEISDSLLDIVNENERKSKFFKLLNNNEEYLFLKEQIEQIYRSDNFKKLDTLQRDFQEINTNLAAIEKSYKDNWKNLSLTQQMSSKQLQNLNFDIFKGTISAPINTDTYLQGNNAKRLEEINDEIPEDPKVKALNSKFPYKDKNILNALKTFKAIMSGAKNIGPTAINNQLIAYLKFFYNFNPNDNNLGLTIGGKLTFLSSNKDNQKVFNVFRGVNNFKSISGSTANISNAVLLAQAVDNIKKDLSVPLNLHKNLMGLRAIMYIVGIDADIVDRMFTEVESVDSLIKDSIKKGTITKFKGNIFKEYINNPSRLVKQNLVEGTENEYTYEINLDLLNKKFKKGEPILETLNLTDQDILAFLGIMQDLANELNDLVQTMNYFYKGFGKNFNQLAYAYIKTNELFNNTEESDLNLNIKGTFIEHKLKTLQTLSSEIYQNFSIYLNNPLFIQIIENEKFRNMFFNSTYLGYLFNALSSANLYINLISQFGSADNLQNAYFKEVTDLMYIFGQNTIVEKQGNYFVKSAKQNNMLGTLQNIIKFNKNLNNIFFANSLEELDFLNEQYKNNISFLGKSESIDTLQTPKSIVDLMSVDNQTLFVGSNTEINKLTNEEVFSAQDIVKKLFFVNMVQSALFSGKTNKGRSNVFDLLFLDNVLLQNDLINPIQGSLHELLKNNNELLSNLQNSNVLDNLFLFSLINNSQLFEQNTFPLSKIKNDDLFNQIVNKFKSFIDSDSFILDFNEIDATGKTDKEQEQLLNRKYVFFYQNFVIIPIVQNNKVNNYFYFKTDLGDNKFNYTKVGIINSFNSKVNPIYFNNLGKITNQLGINNSNYVPVEISKDTFIRKHPNYRSYGLRRDIIEKNITEVEQELLDNSTGVISVINPNVQQDFSRRSLDLKPYNTKFVRVTSVELQNQNNNQIKIKDKNFVLNTGQTQALNKFQDFLQRKDSYFLLKGRGGTGKSTIASKMLEEGAKNGYTLYATAVSDAATSNLKNLVENSESKLKVSIFNFASLFGLVPEYDANGIQIGFDFPSDKSIGNSTPKFEPYEKILLVFDEASMVSKDILDKIKKLMPNAKILFMGDNAQAKPIEKDNNSNISSIFNISEDNKAELTEVMRQKEGSPILNIATDVAEELDNFDNKQSTKFSSLEDLIYEDFDNNSNSGVKILKEENDFIEEAVKDFKKYPGKDTIVVTGNNNNVERLNNKIREKIFNKDDGRFIEGERLMTYSKYTLKLNRRDKIEIFNSSVVTIKKVYSETKVGSVNVNSLLIEFIDDQGQLKSTVMNVIHKQDKEKIALFYKEKQELVKEYQKTKNTSILDALQNYNQTVLVDYNYAMTAHKVQGQTVRNTYVLPEFRGFTEEEARRLFYTSITRPTEKLVILGTSKKPKPSLDKILSITQPTVQPVGEVKDVKQNNIEVVSKYTNEDLKNNPDKIFIFGDNTQRIGTGGQAQIRNNSNALGIATKLKPATTEDAYMSDNDLEKNKEIIDLDIAKIKNQNKIVVFPKDGLGTGLAKLKEKAPKTYDYLKQRLLEEFGFNNDTGEIISNKIKTKPEVNKDRNLRFKFNTNANETILLTKSFANKDSLSDETKKMIDGHIKLGNKFIFSSNVANKMYLEYLVDKKYTNFEIFGQNSKNDMSENEINLLLNKLNPSPQQDLTDTNPDDSTKMPDCI